MNGPVRILINLVVFAVIGGIALFASPLTIDMAREVAMNNPLIAGGLTVFVIFLILFGKGGSGTHHHHH